MDPIKQVWLKQRSELWMDGRILDLINQRDQALHNFRKSKIADDFKHFSKLRNKVQYSIRKAKRHFYNNKIEDHKNSSSDLWKTLISLGTSSKMKSVSTSIGLDVDGLSPRKAAGLDDLPARFIRDGAEGIAYPISYIRPINLSLKTGVVPDEMKTARVISLYKKNSKL